MTNADQILASIDENSGWDHYLILADAFADESRSDEEEAVRWIVEKGYRPWLGKKWWLRLGIKIWCWWSDRDGFPGSDKSSHIPYELWSSKMHLDSNLKKQYGFEHFHDAIHSLIKDYLFFRQTAGTATPQSVSSIN